MNLDEVRAHIDEIDTQMKSLFLERMECSRQVAETKARMGSDNVFVPEREIAIIEKRATDIDASLHDEYVAFIRHLMSVSRRYQYGILTELQDKTMKEALETAGLDGRTEHTQVKICFVCGKETSDLNLFLNMAKLNGISIAELQFSIKEGKQKAEALLEGNIKEAGMRQFLCQTAKESEDFRIMELR